MKTALSRYPFALLVGFCGLIFVSIQAGACISFPKKINLSMASFDKEVFSLPETDKGIAFEHNQTSFFFNHVTNQWCVFADKSKQDEKPVCLKDGQNIYLTDDREGPNKGKEIGLFTVTGKSILLFSCNGRTKDTSRPYLKLTDTTTITERNKFNEPGITEKIYKSAIKVEAMSFSQGVLGDFDIEARNGGPLTPDGSIKAPKTRSFSLAGDEAPIELTGKSVLAEAGCNGKTKIESRSGGAGNGGGSGIGSRGPGTR